MRLVVLGFLCLVGFLGVSLGFFCLFFKIREDLSKSGRLLISFQVSLDVTIKGVWSVTILVIYR